MSESSYQQSDEYARARDEALFYIPPELRMYCVDEAWLLEQLEKQHADTMARYIPDEYTALDEEEFIA